MRNDGLDHGPRKTEGGTFALAVGDLAGVSSSQFLIDLLNCQVVVLLQRTGIRFRARFCGSTANSSNLGRMFKSQLLQ